MTFDGAFWDILTSIGTVGAVIVSLLLAGRESKRAKRAEDSLRVERAEQVDRERFAKANLVTAWTESSYEVSTDGTHYTRRVVVYLSNESSAPVFDVVATLADGSTQVQLGPLSLPLQIPVLAAHHTRSWDITPGVLARSVGVGSIPTEPLVKMTFTDSEETKWFRAYDGVLIMGDDSTQAVKPDEGELQLGPMENGFNPLFAASAFLSLLSDAETTADLRQILAPSAKGWRNIANGDLQSMKSDLSDYGLAAHAWYPTPRVAYVRLIHDDDIDLLRSGQPGRVQMLTLVLLPGDGWKVFSVGPAVTEPDWVAFPKASLFKDAQE